MKDILNDVKFKKLLKEKQRLEMCSWVIPLISIGFLLIILYLTSQSIKWLTIVILILLILLIIGGYVFDNKITIKIRNAYQKLNDYFKEQIVPKLLVVDNPTIKYDTNKKIDVTLIEEVQLFNNFTEYNSYFHYTGILEKHKFSFNEVLFENLVEYDTTGQKILNEDIKGSINYHWYTFELDKEYLHPALYKISSFENYDGRLIKGFQKYDFTNCKFNLNNDLEIDLFLKDINETKQYISDKILNVLNDDYIVYNSVLAIYINNNELHIIIEEFNDLIDLSHCNKIIIENLLKEYNNEQNIIKMLVTAFNN